MAPSVAFLFLRCFVKLVGRAGHKDKQTITRGEHTEKTRGEVPVLEDRGPSIDGVPGELQAAQVDQQHSGELTLAPTGGLLIFHHVAQ